jgi:hypothetical protein
LWSTQEALSLLPSTAKQTKSPKRVGVCFLVAVALQVENKVKYNSRNNINEKCTCSMYIHMIGI